MKFMVKNKIIWIIFLLIIICISPIVVLKTKNITIERDKDNDSISDQTYKSIIFTRTYRIVKKLEYKDNINEYSYIVVDKFQEFKPYIIKIRKEEAKELKENNSYEFTLKGIYQGNINYSNISELFEKFEIEKICITDKKGLEQVQEAIT